MPRIFHEERVKFEQVWNKAARDELEHGKERLTWVTSLSEPFKQWASSISLYEGVKASSPPHNKSFHFTVECKGVHAPFVIKYFFKTKRIAVQVGRPFTKMEDLFFQHAVERMEFDEKEWEIEW